jgi:Trk K+ transport system NAD-binding subunit
MTGDPSQGSVLVCGLGSLGQICLLRLLAFDVPLWGVDLVAPVWRYPDLEPALEGRLVLGDMRSPSTLSHAAVASARAVLLLSSESTVNFEAALQVRLLNPTAQIVVRSSRPHASLGALMERRLPGIAVVDPLLLTASAVAQVLGQEGREATFLADGQACEVFHAPNPGEATGQAIDSRHVRMVRLPPESRWLRPRQDLTLMAPIGLRRAGSIRWRSAGRRGVLNGIRRGMVAMTEGARRARVWCLRRPPLPVLGGAVIAVLLLMGVASFAGSKGWKQGLFVTLALLKGEYVDPVNVVLHQGSIATVDETLIAVTLLYSLLGTLLTSALVAVILDRLLRERLGLGHRHRLRRDRSQILLVQGGSLAGEISAALRRTQGAVVRVETELENLRGIPAGEVVFDQLDRALTRLRSCRVAGIALLSDDLLANLQGALSLEERWPEARLVILAHAVEAAERLGELLGGFTVVSIMDVAADALVATAFGERVEGVLRINGTNLLLVRYRVEKGDTLDGRSVSRIANGYGVNVVTLRQNAAEASRAFPAPEVSLMQGDQIVALADLAGLRRVELGLAQPPGWRLRLECHLPPEGHFEVRQCLARFLGLPPGATASWLDGGEHRTDPVDEDVAQRLRDRLGRLGVRCAIEEVRSGP